MSNKTKKQSGRGVRYTEAQKSEILKFIADYNAKNGRGGQSAASKKYKVTPLTLSGWQKNAGGKVAEPAQEDNASKPAPVKKDVVKKVVPAKKAAKVAKAPAAAANAKKGRRYSSEEKQQVNDFANSWNARKGRGGQSQASKKFNLSVLTISTWLKKGKVGAVKAATPAKAPEAPKAAPAPKAEKVAKAAKPLATAPAGLAARVASLLELGGQIRKAEFDLGQLRAKYDTLSTSIKSSL